MNLPKRLASVFAIALMATVGCAEVPQSAGFASSELPNGGATSQQGVTVETRFVLSGLEGVQSEVALDELFVNVGQVVLDPSDGDGVAFASGRPFGLSFDVARGAVELDGPTLELPYGGHFFVSVQLEPGAVQVSDDKGDDSDGSLVARGHYYTAAEIEADEPSPLPWEPKGGQWSRNLTEHVEFVYESHSVARIQLGEVRLTGTGDYELVLDVRVGSWLEDDVFPRVLEERERRTEEGDVPTSLGDTDGVTDVEAVLDEGGEGLEGLVGDMGVGARRH